MSAQHVDVTVHCRNQAYQVAAQGKRASSTQGASIAAQRLGEKIFGPNFHHAEPLPPAEGDDHNVSRWRLEARGVNWGAR